MAETALNIAQYILGYFQQKGEPISNLKLQKLLYYSQAWHLALYDGLPLFEEEVEAWVHGPVVPCVFRRYKAYRWSWIQEQIAPFWLEPKVVAHVNEVLDAYGNLSAWDLERMTHNELPWKEARGNLPPDESSNVIISRQSMQKFYSQIP